MLIKRLIFKNPFEKRYNNAVELKNLNKINVLIGKNNSGKTTILDHLTTFLSRLNQSNGALSHMCIEMSIKELIQILNKILISPPQLHGSMQTHSTLDEDKLKIFKDFKSYLEKIEDFLEMKQNIELIFYRNLEEKKILNIEYKVDKSFKNSMISSFIEKLTTLEKYQLLSLGELFNFIIQNHKKMYICATRCLDPGDQYTDKPIPNVNTTIRKFFENRISSNSIIDDDNQYKFEIFRIPNFTLILEYIKRGEIAPIHRQKLDKSFIDKFKKNLKKFFPRYDLSTYLRLNVPEVGQQILDNSFDIGGWKGLGHGHQQLISLLFLFALPDNYIYFIDEPDIGLHPELQIKLLQFVNEIVSDNQYDKQFFFATHSPCFIDYNLNCSHFLCQKDSKKFGVKLIEKKSLSIVRDELGFTPGSLFQATGIIWVEGPSEYSYIRLLFECFNFDIDNYGIVVVPYFGSENITKKQLTFKKLKEINQNFLIIMDSDKKGRNLTPHFTKLNIKKKFEKMSVFFWLIESYCDIEGFLPQSFLNKYFQIEIQEDNSHVKNPYIKLKKYVEILKDSGIIHKNSPNYKKNRDASQFRTEILKNKKFKNEIVQKPELQRKIGEMIELIKKWANIPIKKNISLSEKNLKSIDVNKLNTFSTPENIAKIMIDLLEINNDDLILDPCVGSGTFIEKIIERKIPNQNIYAFDIDHNITDKISQLNINFKIKDTLLDFSNDLLSKFDKIVLDPPIGKVFSTEKDKIVKLYQDFYEGRLESLFIINGIRSLKTNGKIAIITHNNILIHKEYEKLREYILKNCLIQKIFQLSLNPYNFKEIDYQPVILILQKKPGIRYEEERINNVIEYIPHITSDIILLSLTSIQGIIQENYYYTAYYRFLDKEDLIDKKVLKIIKKLLNTYNILESEDEKKKVIDNLSQHRREVVLYLIDTLKFNKKTKVDVLKQLVPQLEKFAFHLNFRNILDNVEDFKLR